MEYTLLVRLRRLALCAAAIAALTGCASTWLSPLERDHPLAGRVWDMRAGHFVTAEAAAARAVAARFVILGEAHDNPDHHRLQAKVLATMLHAGRRPALAMEQFDREHQTGLDAARSAGEADAERIADAGRFDRKGWRWPDYRPLVELALKYRLPLVAANLSRENARALMRSGRPAQNLAAAPAGLATNIERDIIEGHCGIRPAAGILAGMVEAQRARDAQMAAAMENAGESGAVLIAGAGHARRDRGAPFYLPAAAQDALLVIAFVEVAQGRIRASEYLPAEHYDLIWFTPRAERGDPCASLRPKS